MFLPANSPRVASYYIRGYLQGAVSKGYKPETLLQQADISPSVYSDANATINGEQLQRLILTVRREMNDHYLGFFNVPGKIGMDIHAGRSSLKGNTLGESLRDLCEFIEAVRSDEQRIYGVDKQGEFSFIYRLSGFVEGVEPHLLYWYRIYWGYKYYCWLTGRQIRLNKVCFTANKSDLFIDYKEIFNCPVLFGQDCNGLFFDQNYLSLPTIRNEVELLNGDFPLRYPNWFSIPGSDQSLSTQVEQVLIELYKESIYSPSILMVSDILAVSSRTLTRKLSKERSSFQKIKTKLRCEQAKRMLLESDLAIAAIAAQLGFSEPGDFTRAFVSWTGKTPSVFRSL